MKSTRSQGGGSPEAFWNVLLLRVHMAFHSARETLACLATADTASKGNAVLQTFSFNEVSKLIMFPCLFLTGWFPTWQNQVPPALTTHRAERPVSSYSCGKMQAASRPRRPRKPDTLPE